MGKNIWFKDSFGKVRWWTPIIMFIMYFMVEAIIQEISRRILIMQEPGLAHDMMASVIRLNAYPGYYLLMHMIWVGIFIWILAKKGLKFFGRFQVDLNFMRNITYGFIFLLVIQQLFGLALQTFFPEESISLNQDILNQSAANMPVWKMVIVFAIIPSVIEEIITRGLFMRYLTPSKPMWGIILSSAVFAGLHVTVLPIHALQYFIMGLGLAVVYWRTGRLEAAIIVHLLNNLLAVAAMITLIG